jgi:protein-S-isoprenylcysteine O-methyltransferase Ste14
VGPYYAAYSAPVSAIVALWGAWMLSWLIAAVWTGRTAARPAVGSQFLYRLIVFAGMVSLAGWLSPDAPPPLWTSPPVLGWAMVALTAAGFGFCWWARLYLGRLWSGSVTRKDDHHIVDTGPYALVRHPIYTGIIVAAFAAAIDQGTVTGFVGVGLIVLGYWMKARLEESFLRGELGAESYNAYARRTGMLLPFL